MKRQRLMLAALLALAAVYMSESAAAQAAVREALELCAASVIPALLPFLVISSLLISLGFGEWAAGGLGWLTEGLFRLPGCAASALVLGLAAGYPVGAKTAAELYGEGLLTREEASRLLTFCNNANPVFLVTVIGRGVFQSRRTGLWLWLIHVAAALLTALLLGRGEHTPCRRWESKGGVPISAAAAFVEAVRKSAWNCVSICGFVTVFYVLSRPFSTMEGTVGVLLTGLTELFSLTPRLTPTGAGFVTAAVCAGFGGVSVLCQTAAVLEGSGLSMRWCVTGKLVQALLSAVMAAAAWQWI